MHKLSSKLSKSDGIMHTQKKSNNSRFKPQKIRIKYTTKRIRNYFLCCFGFGLLGFFKTKALILK